MSDSLLRFVSGLALLLAVATGCQGSHGTLSPEQVELNVQSFEQVWTTVRDRHWDDELGGIDWQAVHDELLPEVRAARTMGEARSIMADAIGRLEQSHFGIIPSEVYSDIQYQADDDDEGSDAEVGPEEEAAEESFSDSIRGEPGMDVRVIEGRALVTRVDAGSPAAAAGVRTGWEILKIRERALEPVIARIADTFADSTLLDFRLAIAVMARMKGSVGDRVELTFLDGDDREVVKQIELGEPRGTAATLGNLPEFQVWFESRRLDGDVGYIAFNAFFDPGRLMTLFGEAVQEFSDCRGIIIDLRGNFGGIGAMAMGMAGWFVSTPGQRLGTMITRSNDLKFVVFPRPEPYTGPLAILIDGLSVSTAEILSGGMKDMGRARLFGTTTAGAALPSMVARLPNGDGFQYAFANYISASGKQLEGSGVTPDEPVRLRREALLQGRDSVIEAALSWILQSSSTT